MKSNKSKTVTVDHREKTAYFRGRSQAVFVGFHIMDNVEEWAINKGYTHIKWVNLPVGNGKSTRCKIT